MDRRPLRHGNPSGATSAHPSEVMGVRPSEVMGVRAWPNARVEASRVHWNQTAAVGLAYSARTRQHHPHHATGQVSVVQLAAPCADGETYREKLEILVFFGLRALGGH